MENKDIKKDTLENSIEIPNSENPSLDNNEKKKKKKKK